LIFLGPTIFLLPVSPLWLPRRPFCLIFARTVQRSVLDGTNGLSSSKPCAYYGIVRSELKPEVVFKVQKMAGYTLFCLIMGPFKGEVPVFARLWPARVRVWVSFTTGAVQSAILATAGLLVYCILISFKRFCSMFALSRLFTANLLLDEISGMPYE